MTKEQQVTKQSLFENGTADYASPTHLIEMYKLGNCPLGDVQASIESIMEQYAKQEAIEFFRFATFRFTRLTGDVWIEKVAFGPDTKWLSTEDLYKKFIQSKEPKQ